MCAPNDNTDNPVCDVIFGSTVDYNNFRRNADKEKHFCALIKGKTRINQDAFSQMLYFSDKLQSTLSVEYQEKLITMHGKCI